MCGIAGIYNTTGEPPDGDTLARMAQAIAHRGPDGERFYTDGGLGLAHRHLRIIDLSNAAMQPMTNEDCTLLFASEIKALLEHPDISARPNLAAIAEYMNAMYTTGEHTWFEGIKRLLPGHYMLADEGGLQVRRWWDVPNAEDPPGARPEKYYVRRAREILEDSVRLRLRSDVPLGAHLSGGIDSSAVVALLSKRLAPSGE